MDRHLGRVRTGDQRRRRDQVEEALPVEPAAPAHALGLLERDVRGRTAERDCAEPAEYESDLAELRAGGSRGRSGHEGVR